MKGIRHESFEFKVKGPKKKVILTARFHKNSYDLVMDRLMLRAIKLSGDPAPKFVRTCPPVTLRGRW